MQRHHSFYETHIKRFLDILCALLALITFSWLYVLIAVLVRVKMGKPILFRQPRPGMIDPKTGRERMFEMYKFRSMTDERNENGELLPDEVRLGKFGKMLRSSSLDELPEAINILRGDMSVIGPRPQLIRDLVFMTDEQRMRHTARPGLSGLAQVMGRNAITWDEKLEWDLKYIDMISFREDARIVILTAKKILGRKESNQELEITDDYGDYLLKSGRVSNALYQEKLEQAKQLITQREK